jgi:hypothetical protein
MFYYVKVAFLHDFPPFFEKKDFLPSGRHASEKMAGHTKVSWTVLPMLKQWVGLQTLPALSPAVFLQKLQKLLAEK